MISSKICHSRISLVLLLHFLFINEQQQHTYSFSSSHYSSTKEQRQQLNKLSPLSFIIPINIPSILLGVSSFQYHQHSQTITFTTRNYQRIRRGGGGKETTALNVLWFHHEDQQHQIKKFLHYFTNGNHIIARTSTTLFNSQSTTNHEVYDNENACSTTTTAGRKNQLIAKTIESFKLSDLYMMEAKLQTNIRNFDTSNRIVMDPNTGSCLFTLDKRFLKVDEDDGGSSPFLQRHRQDDIVDKEQNAVGNTNNIMPSILRRCDWVCNILAYGTNVNTFLEDLLHEQQHHSMKLRDLSLDYIYMGEIRRSSKGGCDSNNNRTDDENNEYYYTSKSLLYRVAQLLLPSKVALNPRDACDKLILIDTPNGIYLGRKLSLYNTLLSSEEKSLSSSGSILNQWSTRPFQYSSSMNPIAAKIIVDLICDLVHQQQQRREKKQDNKNKNQSLSMIDVTCGSGTFLALALDHEMNVYGYDINDKCVLGTMANLIHVFGREKVGERANISVFDSSSSSTLYSSANSTEKDMIFSDCAVSNLPWGQNTEMNVEENKQILKRIKTQLKPDSYCAFITKDESLLSVMKDLSYEILDSVHIPQRNFALPSSKKKKSNTTKRGGSSDCVVTIVKCNND